MQKIQPILLGVNIDHIATIRQARFTRYPDPVQAVFCAEEGGADGITVHLREDRRHIQERDVDLIRKVTQTKLNLEMAISDAMVEFALKLRPEHCCLVPEKREELTTEGGLNVIAEEEKVHKAVSRLKEAGIDVALFIDPDQEQIAAAHQVGEPTIELHTGEYADALDVASRQAQLVRIAAAASFAQQRGLIVNAGHGLHYHNTQAIAGILEINELNIGHAIIARALFVGLTTAVKEMKALMVQARFN